MKLAIMQPYFFPYVGYFQLAAAVDRFVFYDDVTYIKSGWINRNRLILAGAPRYITVPLSNASSFHKINAVTVSTSTDWRGQMLDAIAQSYAKAPYFKAGMCLVEEVVQSHDGLIATIAKKSVTAVFGYLGLDRDFVASSVGYENQALKGAARVLDICRREKATEYWNLPGGKSLYSVQDFESQGLRLEFLKVQVTSYPQQAGLFVPNLSILDVLMFNSPARTREMIMRTIG